MKKIINYAGLIFLLITLHLFIAAYKIGAESVYIGQNADNDICLYFRTSSATPPFICWDQSGSSLVFSNDGSTASAFGTGSGGGGSPNFDFMFAGYDSDADDYSDATDWKTGKDNDLAVIVDGSPADLEGALTLDTTAANFRYSGRSRRII